MRSLTCDEIEESLPAMALGALDEGAREDILAHIDECPNCRKQYSQYVSVAHGLLDIVPQRVPPPVIRASLLKAVSPQKTNPLAGMLRWLSAGTSYPRWAFGAIAVAVVLLAAFAVTQYVGIAGQRQLLSRQLQEQQLTVSILAQKNKESVAMIGTSEASGASATLLFESTSSTGVLVVHDLPALPENKSYQLWLIDAAGKRDSGAIFNTSTDSGNTTSLIVSTPRGLKQYVKCGISIEPRGGSPKPTGPAALTGTYS
jgi:anti-sigma-K factor RskA